MQSSKIETQVPSNEWKIVTKDDKKRVIHRRYGRPRSRLLRPASVISVHPSPSSAISEQKKSCNEMLSTVRIELESLPVMERIISSVSLIMPHMETVASLVCYGIGNFFTSSASAYQLALAFLLRDFLNIRKVYYLDPNMTQIEEQVLLDHNVEVLSNQQGRQEFLHWDNNEDEGAVDSVQNDRLSRRILFFMPHCPRQLYENVVSAHYHQMQNILILGNSLTAYVEALPLVHEIDNQDTQTGTAPNSSFLEAILPHVRETPILLMDSSIIRLATGNLEGAFNDTYWIDFLAKPLTQLPKRRHVLQDHGTSKDFELL